MHKRHVSSPLFDKKEDIQQVDLSKQQQDLLSIPMDAPAPTPRDQQPFSIRLNESGATLGEQTEQVSELSILPKKHAGPFDDHPSEFSQQTVNVPQVTQVINEDNYDFKVSVLPTNEVYKTCSDEEVQETIIGVIKDCLRRPSATVMVNMMHKDGLNSSARLGSVVSDTGKVRLTLKVFDNGSEIQSMLGDLQTRLQDDVATKYRLEGASVAIDVQHIDMQGVGM